MKVFYDKDADLSLIKGKKVTIIGYGSQGHAHAQNLNDSGVKVTVGLRKDGASWKKAANAGLQVKEVAEAVKDADVVMMLLPDEQIAEVYKNEVHANIKQGAALAFAHGFNVHYGQVIPRADLDVIMIAPPSRGSDRCSLQRCLNEAGKSKDFPLLQLFKGNLKWLLFLKPLLNWHVSSKRK